MSPDGAARVLDARLRGRLREWEAVGLLRTLRPPSGVDLSSNDYLQLSSHPHVVARFADAVRRSGAGSTGSRLLRGERESFERVERRFAAFKHADASRYFSSGYLANVAVLTTLPQAGDVILSDERNHASLIDGARLSRATTCVFPHNDAAGLKRTLGRLGQDAPDTALRFVVVESLFSMDGDMAPLADYAEICGAHGAALIVDEAHAVGIYGDRGSGLVEATGIGAIVTASINTAGKALGVAGAFVAGPASTIAYLTQRARPFVFSTAPPPALADALEASLDVLEAEPERRLCLRQRSAHLRTRLADCGIEVLTGSSQILSLVIGDNDRTLGVASRLQDEGFDVRAIRPPTVPEGTARLRISVNVGLSEATLDAFAEALAVALREAGVPCAVSS
jgi:8-amino-7-oxononanoate synthase